MKGTCIESKLRHSTLFLNCLSLSHTFNIEDDIESIDSIQYNCHILQFYNFHQTKVSKQSHICLKETFLHSLEILLIVSNIIGIYINSVQVHIYLYLYKSISSVKSCFHSSTIFKSKSLKAILFFLNTFMLLFDLNTISPPQFLFHFC